MNRRRFLQALGIASATPVALAPSLSRAQQINNEVAEKLVPAEEIFNNPLTATVIEPTCDINAMALYMTLIRYTGTRFPFVPKLKAWLTYTNRCDSNTAMLGAKDFIQVITTDMRGTFNWPNYTVKEEERKALLGCEEFFDMTDRWEYVLNIRWG